jgi:phosphate transport system substrate-binding protein
MRKILLALVIFSALIFYGCSEPSVEGNVVKEAPAVMQDIEIKGSDTLLQVVSNLAESYSTKEGTVRISVTGGGSGTGIAALINGEVDLADSSRQIKQEEINLAKEKGIVVKEFIIGRDMLSVVAHPSNPVKQLTMNQLSQIYSGKITNWKEVGGEDKEITLYGRQSTSGTYAFFMEHVVKGEYSPKMMNMEGNQAIIDAVARDKTGIGYSGIGYIMDSSGKPITIVSVINVAKDSGSEYISPLDKARILDYPISRGLYQYAANLAQGSATYKFLQFELGEEGQQIVEKSGFIRYVEEDAIQNQKMLAQN